MMLYERGVPGRALNLNSTGFPDHGRYGDLPLQEKIPTAEPGIEPGTSWLVVRCSDHQATRLVVWLNIAQCVEGSCCLHDQGRAVQEEPRICSAIKRLAVLYGLLDPDCKSTIDKSTDSVRTQKTCIGSNTVRIAYSMQLIPS
jgi:hypothetical protein